MTEFEFLGELSL